MQAASRLKAEQVLVPSECAFCTFKRDYPWRNPEHPYEWSDGTVSRILENEEYAGTQISCRTHKVSDKSGMVIPVPEEERYRVENTHEAIIGLETGEIVRRIRAHKRRPVKLGEADLLLGMVFCADCGHTLHISQSGSWDESRYTYVCGTYNGHKKECTPHTIRALHLWQLAKSLRSDSRGQRGICRTDSRQADWAGEEGTGGKRKGSVAGEETFGSAGQPAGQGV